LNLPTDEVRWYTECVCPFLTYSITGHAANLALNAASPISANFDAPLFDKATGLTSAVGEGVGLLVGSLVVGLLVVGSLVVGSLVVGSLVVGSLVVGSLVVGSLVVGSLVVGSLVVGSLVVGSLVVGSLVVGSLVVGDAVGLVVGDGVGSLVVGDAVGSVVGDGVGEFVGPVVGEGVGSYVGPVVGDVVGLLVVGPVVGLSNSVILTATSSIRRQPQLLVSLKSLSVVCEVSESTEKYVLNFTQFMFDHSFVP